MSIEPIQEGSESQAQMIREQAGKETSTGKALKPAEPSVPSDKCSFWRRLDLRVATIILLALVSILIWRATTSHAKPRLVAITTLPVAVAKVTREDLAQELICDA